jgi:hypothetical protein
LIAPQTREIFEDLLLIPDKASRQIAPTMFG